MADGFSLDPGEVKAMYKQLTEFDERIGSIRKRLEKAGRNTLGTSELDHACDDFQDRWGDGLDRLNKAAKAISEGFTQAMGEYATIDHKVRADVARVETPDRNK
ncbi:hypothetical protein [Streptomyces sp. cg35]|uniref:hypothetical protein n=1 Tax=Streptomyces sp. cg35 TaxID=3421650 RepID=UPI003D1871B9